MNRRQPPFHCAMSEVYFTDLRADRPSKNVPNKIARLFRAAKISSIIEKGDLVAIKSHFGEPGSTTFLRPQYCAKVVELVAKAGGKPFLTDSNTLYKGGRQNAVDHLTSAARHGFLPPVVNAPLVIADGLTGRDQTEIKVDLKHCKTVKVGSAAHYADAIVCVSHVKGHMLTGFGGALKNLGMGFGSRVGKLEMHQDVKPEVDEEKCKACGECERSCPAGAITIRRKARIDLEKCIGCGECYASCYNEAIKAGEWSDPAASQEKIVEYCYGIINEKPKKLAYFNFIVDFTPLCDCPPFGDAPIIPNVGILASMDIVAIDQASADLVNAQEGLAGTKLKHAFGPGEDKIRDIHGIDWTIQLKYAESLGLGSRKYELVKV